MNRKGAGKPSLAEVRLRQELARTQRELARLGKKGADTGEDAEPLRARVAELERTKKRLSRLYFTQLEETRRRAGNLLEILRFLGEIRAELDPDALLERVASAIRVSLGFRIVFLRVREPGTDRLRGAASAGLSSHTRQALDAQPVTVPQVRSWLREEFRVSRSYLIRHTSPFSQALPSGYVPDLGPREEWEWHAEDVLLVPWLDGQGELVGYCCVDDPESRLPPSRETIELLEILGGHALAALEAARRGRDLAMRADRLEEAERHAREASRLKRDFLATVSGELRRPLAAIQARADALLGEGDGLPPARLREFLHVVNDEGERLGRLIDSALDLGGPEAGGPARRRRVELRQVLEECRWLVAWMADARRVELKLEQVVADTHLDADRDRMRQLVLHLASNAVQYTPAGGSVTLRVAGDEHAVVLQVEDTGVGMPEEGLRRILQLREPVNGSPGGPGSAGSGLPLCRSIVEGHGGLLSVTSEVGRGSCFTVVLPRRARSQVVLRPGSELGPRTQAVLALATEMVSEVMEARVVSLMSRDADGGLVIEAAVGLDEAVVRDARARPGVGVSGWVAQHGRPVCVGDAGHEAEGDSAGAGAYRTGTFLSVPLVADKDLLGVLNVTDPSTRQAFRAEDCNLLVELAAAITRAWEQARESESSEAAVAGATEALRTVVEHVRSGRIRAPHRVSLAQALAHEMGLSEAEIAQVAMAAAVHDVGMTRVDPRILQAGRVLTDAERAEMRRHVELGAEVVGSLAAMAAARDTVLCHHEWWDGSGYPRGLEGRAIPVGARILAVVDAYESITLGRAHRPARAPEQAWAEIRRLRGRQFDPAAVDALERVLARPSVPESAGPEATEATDAAPASPLRR